MIIAKRAKRNIIDMMIKYLFVYEFLFLNFKGVLSFAFGRAEQIISQADSSQSKSFYFQFVKGEFK